MKDSKNNGAGEESFGKALDLKLLPSHRNMDNWTALIHFVLGGSWKEFKHGRDNQTSVMFALQKKKKKNLALSFSGKKIQNTNGDMNDGPISFPHAVMKEKLRECNLIVGGTHSANRVCQPDMENVFICIREVIDSWHRYHMGSGSDSSSSSTEITQQVL